MKKLLVSVLLLCFVISFAQTTYHFDKMLTYEYTEYQRPQKNHIRIYLINSLDNSFFAYLDDKGQEDQITFVHQDILYAQTSLHKTALINGDIRLNCDSISNYQNPYKYQTRNYDFTPVKDTLVNNKNYKYYYIRHNKPKMAIKKKAGRLLYIINTENSSLPLLTYPTAFEEWKLNRNIPNGIIEEIHFYNYKGEHITTERLIKSENIHKTIFTPDCPSKTITTTSTRIINTRH